MASTILSGIIKTIFPSEVYGNYEKRILWLEEPTTERYPQTFQIEFAQGMCNVLDEYKAGDLIEVYINLNGRHVAKDGKEWVFNSLRAWKIAGKGVSQANIATYEFQNSTDIETQYESDLPF